MAEHTGFPSHITNWISLWLDSTLASRITRSKEKEGVVFSPKLLKENSCTLILGLFTCLLLMWKQLGSVQVFFQMFTEEKYLLSLGIESDPGWCGSGDWVLWPVNQRVAGSIPVYSTCLGCGPGSQWGARERQPHTDVSLPFFPLPLKINTKNKKN